MKIRNAILMIAVLTLNGCVYCQPCAEPHAAADNNDSWSADEQLYRKRFAALYDRTSATGIARYDTLQPIAGAGDEPLPKASGGAIAPQALKDAAEYAAQMNSTALFVWRDGRIETEQYFGDTDRDTLLVSKSLAKPLGVVAVGRAIEQGLIASLDEPVATYIEQWQGTDKAAILVRHLLDMRPGLLPQGPAPTVDNVLNRAYLHPRHDEVIINDYPLTHEPGSRYEYANATAELVAPLIERATGVQYEDWVANEVLKPIGAPGGEVWMNRIGGTAHSGCCWMLPAQTYVRLGILLLNDGVVNGKRLLPEGYVEQMTTPTPHNPHSGMGVYVAGDYIERRGPLNPSLDIGRNLHSEPYLAADLFLFDGNSNQVVYIVPSLSLVIARFGNRPPRDPEWDNAYLPNTIIRGLPSSVRTNVPAQQAAP